MQFLQGNNLPRVKASNQSAIMRMIYYYGPTQRAEIAEKLELTLPTITTNINKMLMGGIVKEKEAPDTVSSTNGRRARLLEINAEAECFVGIELQNQEWDICISDFCGNLKALKSGEVRSNDYEDTMELLGSEFLRCLDENGKSLDEISGVGICMQGSVDRANGVLKSCSRKRWSNKKVCEDFARLTGYEGKVTLENGATARGTRLRLFHWNQLQDEQVVAYMVVSNGIACPVFLNTVGYRGSVVGAGEAGHIVVNPYGRACKCGNRGCLEAYASEEAIRNDCRKAMGQGKAPLLKALCQDPERPQIHEIMLAQEEGDKDVCQIVEDAIGMLSIAVGNIINFTRPDVMLIDGKLFSKEENRLLLLGKARGRQEVADNPQTLISFVESGRVAGVQGAVAVAIDEHLELINI